MIERHKKEEWDLLKQQLDDQRDILRKLMEATQASQMKQLEAKHEREIKTLNSLQAKISVETSKEVANDKTLKTKGEKDRRLREKKQNNIKRFMDEKKVLKFLTSPKSCSQNTLFYFTDGHHQAEPREGEAQGDTRQATGGAGQ